MKTRVSSRLFLRSSKFVSSLYLLVDKPDNVLITQVLYNKDCISDQAIIYWHQKGSKPQGKQHFLKSTEPLVKVCLFVVYFLLGN